MAKHADQILSKLDARHKKGVERGGCKRTSHQLLSKISTNAAVPLKTTPQTRSLINHQCF